MAYDACVDHIRDCSQKFIYIYYTYILYYIQALCIDVNQYCNIKNSVLSFKTHTRQWRAELLQCFDPEIGPSSGFTSRTSKAW